jgi:hypothetical protein
LKDCVLSNFVKDAAPLTRRRTLRADLIFGIEVAMCILLPATWFCAFVDCPHQFWVESYRLRWVVYAAMVLYVWWLWPQISEAFGKNRKGREAFRVSSR